MSKSQKLQRQKLFIAQVAKGRGKSVEEIKKIAGGRIWSGEDALKVGLVDALGGFQDALRLAKQEAGLPLDVSFTNLVSQVQQCTCNL